MIEATILPKICALQAEKRNEIINLKQKIKMSTNEFNKEYFRIGRVNNNSYPILAVSNGGIYERKRNYVENPEPMEYRIKGTVPAKVSMVDFHKTPYSVVSQKIHDILAKLNIKGLQLIPATIIGKNDEKFEKYWFLNIYNKISAMDREKSTFDWDDDLSLANPIEKLVLNEKLLSGIPLEERLIFRLEENKVFEIYHKSVVDAIMATNPEGIMFTSVADWHI